MKIHLVQTCAAFDYELHLTVNKVIYRADRVMIRYKDKELIIPLANIICLEPYGD